MEAIGLVLILGAYWFSNKPAEVAPKATPKSEIEQATESCEGSIKRFKHGSLMFECKDNSWEESE